MSDRFKTILQQEGLATATPGTSLAELIQDVIDLGIDPRHVVLLYSTPVKVRKDTLR